MDYRIKAIRLIDCFAEEYVGLMDKVVQYLNSGGHHPSLVNCEDPAMTPRYLQEVESSLWHRKKLKKRSNTRRAGEISLSSHVIHIASMLVVCVGAREIST